LLAAAYGGNIPAHHASSQPTSAELTDLSAALTKLWDLDTNRLKPGGEDYLLDTQGKASYNTSGWSEGGRRDKAANPLFSKNPLDHPEVFAKKPTFKAFISLLDNYVCEAGVKEVVTAGELQEQSRFLDKVGERLRE
jgi:poly(U)-specific endoribonuclease